MARAAHAPGPARATAELAARSWAALSFGFLLAFGSSVGQSYFIGLFGAELRTQLGLSHGAFGGIYAAATIASAIALLFVGKLADRLHPRNAALITTFWLTGAAALMAFVTHPVMLALALFALRLGGQGMMSHIALTTLGRWFQRERGRAVALATLGFPAAEAVLPPVVALGLVQFGFKAVWLFAAGILIALVSPALALLSTLAVRERDQAARQAENAGAASRQPSWTQAQVLRDTRFYALCPGLLAPPFIVTGLLFHQAHLAEINGWSLPGFAALFPLFAGAALAAGLGVGALADRYGSRRIVPFFLAPLGAALLLFSLTDALPAAGLAMALTGVTAGGATVLFGTLWVELYGPAHLGAIRALTVSLMVLATALAPAAMGALIDLGLSLDLQFQGLSLYIVVCIAVLLRLRPRLTAQAPPPIAAESPPGP